MTDPRQVYGGPSGQRDLGRVYVTPQDANAVQAARIAITRRLLTHLVGGGEPLEDLPPPLWVPSAAFQAFLKTVRQQT